MVPGQELMIGWLRIEGHWFWVRGPVAYAADPGVEGSSSRVATELLAVITQKEAAQATLHQTREASE